MNTKIAFFNHDDTWQDVKNATMNTIGKATGAYPNGFWKHKLLMAEHSPIRKLKFAWRWTDLPYWVSTHFVRHKIGIEHFVKTQRTDRTGIDRTELPQGAPVSHECEADAQALINISRKRLCNAAAAETRAAWQLVKDEVAKIEPEVASCMVRECVYRGHCPEMFPCGFCDTDAYQKEMYEYLSFQGVLTPHDLGRKPFYASVWQAPWTMDSTADIYDIYLFESLKDVFNICNEPEKALLHFTVTIYLVDGSAVAQCDGRGKVYSFFPGDPKKPADQILLTTIKGALASWNVGEVM